MLAELLGLLSNELAVWNLNRLLLSDEAASKCLRFAGASKVLT